MLRSTVHCLIIIAMTGHSFAQQPGEPDLSFSEDGIATAHFAPNGIDHALGMAFSLRAASVSILRSKAMFATAKHQMIFDPGQGIASVRYLVRVRCASCLVQSAPITKL